MKIKQLIIGLLVMSGLFLGVGATASADSTPPPSFETAWNNDMNQASYWETYFAKSDRIVTCTKYSNHSGYIPAECDAAVIKDGASVVKVYSDLTNVGAFTATGAINPSNGKPYGAPHSWVMKCKWTHSPTTTTTVVEVTTTILATTSSTSTTIETTTSGPSTTLPEITTSTAASTTTTGGTTSPTTTPTTVPELPSTGNGGSTLALFAVALLLIGSSLVMVRRS